MKCAMELLNMREAKIKDLIAIHEAEEAEERNAFIKELYNNTIEFCEKELAVELEKKALSCNYFSNIPFSLAPERWTWKNTKHNVEYYAVKLKENEGREYKIDIKELINYLNQYCIKVEIINKNTSTNPNRYDIVFKVEGCEK